MKRREFIALLGGAAVAWPIAGVAQEQPERMRRVGVLISSTEDDPQVRRQTAAFQQGLLELGWMEGRNVRIDFRFLGEEPNRLKTYAAELVALKPDAVLASGPTAVVALQQEFITLPIVFTQVNDPVGAGLVETLARPGRNVTGFTPTEFSIAGKMLEMLRDLASDVGQVGVILDAKLSDQIGMWLAMDAVAQSLGLRLQQLGVPEPPADIENSIGSFARAQNRALIVLANSKYHCSPETHHRGGRQASPTCDVLLPLLRRRWRLGFLWCGPGRTVQARGFLRGSNPQGRKAGRPPGPATDQVRASDQPEGGQGARPRSAADAAGPRRRGYRMSAPG